MNLNVFIGQTRKRGWFIAWEAIAIEPTLRPVSVGLLSSNPKDKTDLYWAHILTDFVKVVGRHLIKKVDAVNLYTNDKHVKKWLDYWLIEWQVQWRLAFQPDEWLGAHLREALSEVNRSVTFISQKSSVAKRARLRAFWTLMRGI